MSVKCKLALHLLRNTALTPDVYLLTFALPPDLARDCRPGQFFNLRPLDSTAPLLRRPISICDVRPEEGEIDFLVQVLGNGTRLVCGNLPGVEVDVIGPLGTAFQGDPAEPALLIAGGVGVAPVYFLARWLRRETVARGAVGAPITFCYGARTASSFVLLDRIEREVSQLALTTEDGSRGTKGYVTEALRDSLRPAAQIFVCGPPAMMQAVLAMMRAKGLEGQFSLENQMGCGVGACMGCVVPSRGGPLRVCCDGPVVGTERLDAVWPH